jgi:spermidine/putrescine transport system substrate-binding protein
MAQLAKLAPAVCAVALVGCGTQTGTTGKEGPVVPAGPVKGTLQIAQWPLYIDPGKHGTVADFQRQTGVRVKYIEEINDNLEFFGKVRPQFQRHQSGGRSLITVSDWLAYRMNNLGYLQRFDQSKLPNVKRNLIDFLRGRAADPQRRFTVPWQSGMTGLIVRTDKAPGVNSINDLFNPKYKGKVTMLSELRDSVPMTLKAMGIDPDKASTDQWLAAVAKIKKESDSGQIRRFTGNDYIKDLPKGDSWIALGWSGDAVQLQKDNPNIKFVMPKEGCMQWATSMEIPVGAPNPQAAQAFINYVYDPKVQADIAEYVSYVTPVKGVKEILRKRDPKLAANQLIFPSKQYVANCTYEPVLPGQRGQKVAQAFENAIGN